MGGTGGLREEGPQGYHLPVLAEKVVEYLAWTQEGLWVDATVGDGGHTALLLHRIGPKGRVLGLDRDPEAVARARERLAPFGSRVEVVQAHFQDLPQILAQRGVQGVRGVLFDLGVSSHQLDCARRGFSFLRDGPLDMRMNPEDPVTAADLVNTLDREALTRLIREYGEERWAPRIAQAILRARQRAPITRTTELARIVESAIPARFRPRDRHSATRTFQALRIAVNQELDVLRPSLEQAISFLCPGGRIVVLAYHSLEDRIVKGLFQELARGCICPPELPVCVCGRRPILRLLTRRPLRPDAAEVSRNPRARSARLRCAERLAGNG